MKKLIIFVSLLFLAMAYGKAEDKEVLKIATFNLRMDTPSDGCLLYTSDAADD